MPQNVYFAVEKVSDVWRITILDNLGHRYVDCPSYHRAQGYAGLDPFAAAMLSEHVNHGNGGNSVVTGNKRGDPVEFRRQ